MLFRFGGAFSTYTNCNCILEADPNTGSGSIWLGDYTAAIDLNLLNNKQIKTVLTVAAGLPVKYAKSDNINHKVYNALDIESYNISKHFADTYNYIESSLEKGNILIHCAAGISRSASVVIAYLMRKRKWSFNQTFDYVRKRRNIICPNFGFVRQLKSYELQLEKGLVVQPQKPQQQQQQQQKIKPDPFAESLQISPLKQTNLEQSMAKQKAGTFISRTQAKSVPKYMTGNKFKAQSDQKIEPQIVTYNWKNNKKLHDTFKLKGQF